MGDLKDWWPDLDFSGRKLGKPIKFTRIINICPPPDPPKCEMCGTTPWILTTHPLSKKNVCLECKTKGTDGWVPCPATHTNGPCPLCRNTPGYIEEA